MTSTPRPRTTTAKSQLSGKSNNNNNLLPSKSEKLEPANSNIFEKSPGKAPKQVKEGPYTTPTTHDMRPTQMSMSKMFERYEKIEQIYPELKPYRDNPAYFTVTNGNGKPSRENSKSFSSFVSVNSAPQKKNSPSDSSTLARQQVVAQAANEKASKGTNQFIFGWGGQLAPLTLGSKLRCAILANASLDEAMNPPHSSHKILLYSVTRFSFFSSCVCNGKFSLTTFLPHHFVSYWFEAINFRVLRWT